MQNLSTLTVADKLQNSFPKGRGVSDKYTDNKLKIIQFLLNLLNIHL